MNVNENISEVFRPITKNYTHFKKKWRAPSSSTAEHHRYNSDNDNIYTLSSQIFIDK